MTEGWRDTSRRLQREQSLIQSRTQSHAGCLRTEGRVEGGTLLWAPACVKTLAAGFDPACAQRGAWRGGPCSGHLHVSKLWLQALTLHCLRTEGRVEGGPCSGHLHVSKPLAAGFDPALPVHRWARGGGDPALGTCMCRNPGCRL